jgi:hypothetical protein
MNYIKKTPGKKISFHMAITACEVEVSYWPSNASLHCKENPIDVFPGKKFHGLIPYFHIHVFVSDLYTYSQDRSTYFLAAE